MISKCFGINKECRFGPFLPCSDAVPMWGDVRAQMWQMRIFQSEIPSEAERAPPAVCVCVCGPPGGWCDADAGPSCSPSRIRERFCSPLSARLRTGGCVSPTLTLRPAFCTVGADWRGGGGGLSVYKGSLKPSYSLQECASPVAFQARVSSKFGASVPKINK